MLKRPSNEETEEDLLRYQQEFLATKNTAATKVVRIGEKNNVTSGDKVAVAPQRDVVDMGDMPAQFTHTSTAPPVKKSRFKAETHEKKKLPHEEAPPAEQNFDVDDDLQTVLTDIVERDFKQGMTYYQPTLTPNGFPSALHRGNLPPEDGAQSNQKKKSIFAQQFALSTPSDFGVAARNRASPVNIKVNTSSVMQPNLVSGSGLSSDNSKKEAMKIHEENVGILSQMSQDEILTEQQSLLSSIDPGLLDYLKRKQKPEKTLTAQEPKEPQPMVVDPPIEKLNLPVEPGKLVHMDKVEADKLEWTKDLREPSVVGDCKTGKPVRFNFDGFIPQEDVAMHEGLHHHGDEPERAGYTLPELFTLARSANMQQRSLALNTLARVILNARAGHFHEMLSSPIIPALLDGGLVFIVRWALDDSSENSIASAVYALRSLLVCTEDEDACDITFQWHTGAEVPNLTGRDAEIPEDGEEKLQETDAEIVKRDVVKGLLRMTLLQRLRYILEVSRPPAAVVGNILDVFIRFARHSSEAAYQIVQCPRLIDTIMNDFLVIDWTPADTSVPFTNAYGFPLPRAMKLIRVICAAGRNMAAILLSKFDLFTRIVRYIASDPGTLNLHEDEAQALFVESHWTWQVFLSYGLAAEQYREMYPLLMGRLQSLTTIIGKGMIESPQLISQASSLVKILESSINVAGCVGTQVQWTSTSTPSEKPALPDLPWSQVSGIQQPIELCVKTVLNHIQESYTQKNFDLTLAACLVDCLAAVLHWLQAQVDRELNPVDLITHVTELSEEFLFPFLRSYVFQSLLQHMRDSSIFIHGDSSPRTECVDSLPEMGSLGGASASPTPVLKPHRALSFVLSLSRLILAVGKINKQLAPKLYATVTTHEETLQYVRKVCQLKTSTLHFAKFEKWLQFYLLSMAKSTPQVDASYHKLSLSLMLCLHEGDEFIAHDLFSTVIFNPDMINLGSNVEVNAAHFEQSLQLAEQEPLGSATQKEMQSSQVQLIDDTQKNLPHIRAAYMQAASGFFSQLIKSRARATRNVTQIETLLTGKVGECIVPIDWAFLPLVHLYNTAAERSAMHADESISEATVSMVTNCLRWIHLVEFLNPGMLDSVSLTLKLSRLLCTFLAGSDLFLDSLIHQYLECLLRIYCRPANLDRLDLTQSIPGLASFYDLYAQVLDQFEAVSFGDALFGSFVLIPMMQKHNISLRRAVWGEHSATLRSLSVPLSQLPISLDRFLVPHEENHQLLRLYSQALIARAVSPLWCPVLYLTAVHHVNAFIYAQQNKNEEESKLKLAILNQIHAHKKQDFAQHLLYYKKSNPQAKFGMDFYKELPSVRKQHLVKMGIAI